MSGKLTVGFFAAAPSSADSEYRRLLEAMRRKIVVAVEADAIRRMERDIARAKKALAGGREMIRAAVLLVWRMIEGFEARREIRRREAERRAGILDLVLKATPADAPLSPLLYGLRPLDPEHPKPPCPVWPV